MYIDLSTLNEGYSQDRRRVKALIPDFIDVDERDIDDLLKFMAEFAAQFNYYDLNNTINGNWADFFRSDIHILLVIITRFDILTQIDEFSALENKLYVAENDTALYDALKNLFGFILNVLAMLNELRDRLVEVNNGSEVINRMSAAVKSFDEEALKLAAYNKEAIEKFGADVKIDIPEYFTSLAPSPEVEIGEIFTGATPNEQVLNGLTQIKQIFNDMGAKFNSLLTIASFYYNNSDLIDNQYQPHLALCVAFLHIYMQLQKKLNGATKQHLDLYYKRILGMDLLEPLPDKVHVVFEKEPNSPDVIIPAGEELLAQIEGQPEPAIFSLNRNIRISSAQIAELRTLFLAEHTQIRNDNNETVTEIQPYNGEYPFITAANYLKSKIPVAPWPLLGQDQDNLPDAEKSMQVSDIGLMITSPVLYQPEGRRTISFSIYIDDPSYNDLIWYFSNYSNVTGKDLVAVSHQLLSGAFLIDYTETNGWKTVNKFSAVLDQVARKLDIEIQINNADEFIEVYKPAIHGGNFDTQWPIFRLLINNYSANNPFTFLRDINMQRITVTADVKGSQAVKLQNGIGPLNPANASQLFGPQPSIGSYLDIKSSNIFNKYTKAFCVRLDWIDLPKDPGGWETYYRAYNNKIVNSSFQVKLSTMADGKPMPKPPLQQQFSLFESNDDGSLASTTQLQSIDMKKLFFNKKPLLDQQDILPDKNFAEGALRIELVAPQDAFGHRLFPQIFPQVVLYNAKHSKKLELPNQPYIPTIHSLSIDHTSTHSEALGPKNRNADEGDLKVIHIYPFGYAEVYPGNNGGLYSLLPDLDQANNIFIGLSDVKPGQPLSLLFQLEKSNYTEMAVTKTRWSFLSNNQWLDIKDEEVLYDDTNNFVNTGIVSIKLPDDINTGNSILSPSLYWIRASSENNITASVQGVYAQAAQATRVITGNTTVLNLAPGNIKMFKRKISGIQSITLPFPSFGGRAGENDAQYYIRVSERLRHGQRLSASRDIELAILQQFPQIYMAKCIYPKDYTPAYIETYRPGLRVILIPTAPDGGLFADDQPRVDLAVRDQVTRFLERSLAPFINVEVKSPVYERLKVICTINFNDDDGIADAGMDIIELNKDITRFLCPWMFEKEAEFKIGAGIHMVELYNFIKNLTYVKRVSDFSVAHFFYDEAIDDIEKKARVNYSFNDSVYIRGSLPQSVLIPSKRHLITVTDDTGKQIGISDFSIMDELLVDDGHVHAISNAKGVQATHNKKGSDLFNLVISHDIDQYYGKEIE